MLLLMLSTTDVRNRSPQLHITSNRATAATGALRSLSELSVSHAPARCHHGPSTTRTRPCLWTDREYDDLAGCACGGQSLPSNPPSVGGKGLETLPPSALPYRHVSKPLMLGWSYHLRPRVRWSAQRALVSLPQRLAGSKTVDDGSARADNRASRRLAADHVVPKCLERFLSAPDRESRSVQARLRPEPPTDHGQSRKENLAVARAASPAQRIYSRVLRSQHRIRDEQERGPERAGSRLPWRCGETWPQHVNVLCVRVAAARGVLSMFKGCSVYTLFQHETRTRI
jgi:hypothetical protein